MKDLKNNLAALYDFYITAKEDNFIKAAEKLHISSNNLSRKIAIFESEIGLQLFNKSNRGISLTLDGERLYNLASGIFNSLEDFNEKYLYDSELIKGHLTIGTTRNIADNILYKYLIMLEKEYPQIELDILIDSASNLNEFLMSRKIDILIDYLPQINYSVKMNMEVKNIGGFKTCFACSREFYEKEGYKIKKIEELKNYKLTIPGKSRRRQLLDSLLQEKNLELNINYRMPDSKLMAEFVNNTDYIGYFIEEEVNDYDLVKLNLEDDMPINTIGIIYCKDSINNIAKKFIELVLTEN